jgi:hypothetical protein
MDALDRWLLDNAGKAIVGCTVLCGRFFAGRPLLDVDTRKRKYAPHVHATFRTAAVGTAAAAAWDWRITLAALGTIGAGLVGSVLVHRHRVALANRPQPEHPGVIHVRAYVGRPAELRAKRPAETWSTSAGIPRQAQR